MYSVTQQEVSSEDLLLKEAFLKREKIAATVARLKVWCGTHISEMQKRHHVVQTDSQTSCEYEDVEVAPTFKCFNCMTLGHHHPSACWL
jgi:hypothetical protein